MMIISSKSFDYDQLDLPLSSSSSSVSPSVSSLSSVSSQSSRRSSNYSKIMNNHKYSSSTHHSLLSSKISAIFTIDYNIIIITLLLILSLITTTIADKQNVHQHQLQQQQQQQQLQLPRIKEHPTSIVVRKGEPARLECKADGNPMPTIEWYKDNVKVKPSKSLLILGDSLFFLYVTSSRKSEHSDTGVYYCKARNIIGEVNSRNATLDVALLKDEFRVMPANTQIAQGKTVTMYCSPPKGRPEPIVQWLHNGKIIDVDKQTNNGRYRLDDTNLVIQDVMKEDQGQYQCIARNMIGTRESPNVTLKVFVEPYFIRPPDNIKTMSGNDIIFHCEVGGDPQPEISWHKINGDIAIDKSQILEDKALKINQVKISDSGTYVCDAENAAGKLSKSATLIVNSLPTLIINPESINTLINNDNNNNNNNKIEIDCMVNGNPKPIHYWHKENTHLLMFPGQQYGHKYNISNNGRLIINNIDRQDEGYYLCSAISTVGSAMSRAHVKTYEKNDVPPPRIRLGATNQTLPLETKAFIPCEALSSLLLTNFNNNNNNNNNDDDDISIKWLFNKQKSLQNDSHFQITSAGLQIQNLQRNHSGIYTCVATSKLTGGTTSWTSRLSVESPRNPNINFSKMQHPTMFPEAPTKPIVVNMTDTSITLRWQRSASSSGSSPSSSHLGTTIEAYSPDYPGQGWTRVANRILSDIFVVKNLHPNTRYLFYVRAQNLHGLGLPSEVSDEIITLNTGDNYNNYQQKLINENKNQQARKILNNVQIKLRDSRAISSTSIKLFWNINVNIGIDFIDGYYIRYESIDNNYDIINDDDKIATNVGSKVNIITVFDGSTYTYTIQDLQKYQSYQFFIIPFYRNVEGKPSNLLIERTLEDRPDAPPNSLKAKIINSTAAIIEWLPPLEQYCNGIILGYYLQIYENNTFLYTNLTLDSTFNSIILYNLTNGSKFSIQISAFTSMGNGPFSKPIYFNMDDQSLTSTTIFSSFDPNDDINKNENQQQQPQQHYLISPIFWLYVLSILLSIILFALAVRLVLFYSTNRSNKTSISSPNNDSPNLSKSLYEKTNDITFNSSDLFNNKIKYNHDISNTTSSTSKYSSCPDNEYEEVADFKHYDSYHQNNNNNNSITDSTTRKQQTNDDDLFDYHNAEPYAMTPLIEKASIIHKQQQQQQQQQLNYGDLNRSTITNPQRLQSNLITHLTNNGKYQTSSFHSNHNNNDNNNNNNNQAPTSPPLSRINFKIFNTDFDNISSKVHSTLLDNIDNDHHRDNDVDIDNQRMLIREYMKQKHQQQQQNSLPSGRSSSSSLPFSSYLNELDHPSINNNRKLLMTFNHHHQQQQQQPANCSPMLNINHTNNTNNNNNTTSTPPTTARIINNPLLLLSTSSSTTYDDSDNSDGLSSTNSHKNQLFKNQSNQIDSNHYYASSEIISNNDNDRNHHHNNHNHHFHVNKTSSFNNHDNNNCDNNFTNVKHHHHNQLQLHQQPQFTKDSSISSSSLLFNNNQMLQNHHLSTNNNKKRVRRNKITMKINDEL